MMQLIKMGDIEKVNPVIPKEASHCSSIYGMSQDHGCKLNPQKYENVYWIRSSLALALKV